MRVCIIGAGASGITAAKVLKSRGIAFDCFEAGSEIGGNWRYENDNGMSSAYATLHINTSKTMMAYSDFPMREEFPDYPSHSQVLQYFEDYVAHFGIRPHIRFNNTVTGLGRAGDRFTVTLESGQRHDFDAVLVANGHHWATSLPDFEGSFDGEAFHSHEYRTPAQLTGKRVLVVGIGNSAVDIACEGCRVAESVTLSTRRGAYVFPKYVFGVPTDTLVRPSVTRMPRSVQSAVAKALLWVTKGRQSNYGVPLPAHRITAAHPTISDELLHLVGHGRIKMARNIKALEPSGALFEDGTRGAFDTIVFATGYRVCFPFLSGETLPTQAGGPNNAVNLYHRVAHPNVPGLYFIGLVQPLGAMMPLAERQSEWVSDLLLGRGRLPKKTEMEREIRAYQSALEARYVRSPRHTIQVDFHPYLRELDREIKSSRKRAQ